VAATSLGGAARDRAAELPPPTKLNEDGRAEPGVCGDAGGEEEEAAAVAASRAAPERRPECDSWSSLHVQAAASRDAGREKCQSAEN
jgi:hypothetical protein